MLNIGGTAVVTTLRGCGAGIYAAAGTAFTTLELTDGTMITDRSTSTTMNVAGPKTTLTTRLNTTVPNANGIVLWGGATWIVQSSSTASLTLTLATIYPGCRALRTGSKKPFTLTTLNRYKGVLYAFDEPGSNLPVVTVTTTNKRGYN